MADLRDNIRLTTVADLEALSGLINEYKKLGLSISGVAGASRIVSEQIKRDALEQANATKQATLQTQLSTAELNRQSAELRKNNLELKAQAAALNESKKSSDSLFGSLSSLTGLRSQLIGLFGAMSVGAFAKDIIDAQSQIQAFDLSMKNILGEKYGAKLTEDLKRFTVETPLNFEQVIKSSNQLVGSFKAAGASSQVIGKEIPIILESLGNSAAALGGEDRLGRLTYAFSQVQATGRLMGTEVRQITETGFPLLAVMSQTTGKKVSELKDDITAGKVSFEDFKKAILSAGLEGGVFAGSMDIMANTVRGRLDKLSETFFFVKGRIGEFFEDSARSGLNFANALLKYFLGTDDAIARTIGTIEMALKTWAGYKVLVTSIAVVEKAMLILEGQKILAMEAEIALRVKNLLQLKAQRIERGLDVLGIDAQIAAINALSTAKVREAQANLVALQEQRALTLARGLDVVAIDAQIATTTAFIARQTLATTAATSFAARMSSVLSPTVLITAAIAALVVVYKEVSDAIDRANELNYDWVKSNDSQIISVTESNIRMKIAAESVMRLKEGTDLHKQALGDLIKTYPQYFGQLDIEKTKNSQIRAIYDQVNKSIEAKIALMAREKIAEETLNRLVSIRRDLIESGVTSTNAEQYNKENTSPFDFSFNRSKIKEYNDLLAKQAQNERAMTNERIKNFNLEYEALKKTEAAKTITRYEFLVQRENLMVKYHLKETAATITHNATQEAQEKSLASKTYKINADNKEQKEIFNEIVRVKALNKTREHEQQILDLQYKYDVSKVNSATGAAIVKQQKLEDLENKHRIKTAELTSKWDAKATGAAKAFANQSIKLQEDTAKEKEVFEELVYVKSLEKTRQHETAILDIEYYYNLSKIQNSVGSVKKKNEEVSKLEKAYAKDSAELNRKWNKEESEQRLKLEEISLKEINIMRSNFRALNSKDEKESLKEQLKAVEDKYKLEMDVILKSNASNAEKRVELMRTIILEEKEISTIKTKLEQLKTAENLRGEAAKKIKKDTDEINEKTEFRNKLNLEQIEHEKDLAQAEAKRYDGILDLISGIIGETKEIFNFNDAINKSKIANDDLIKKKENLLDIISKGQLLTKEGAKAQKEADEATVKSVEATNQVQLLAYTTLLSVAQKVFEGIKKSIVENMLLVSKSYEESNRIFQEFVVKKREADLKAYQDDLEYRLELSKENLDEQLRILEDYFDKAKQLIDERDLADAYAAEFESLVKISNENAEFSTKVIEGYSLNGLETIKNMVTNTLTVIGKANDGLTREQEAAYQKVVATADAIIEKLEWQRDNTVELLDRTIDIYRDKYKQQTDIVKEETDNQIDAINNGLSANLDRLGSFYDAQGEVIRKKYGDILDNNVRYTDTAFEEQLRIWDSARIGQEKIITDGRDAELGILKEKYNTGKITLEEYLAASKSVQDKASEDLLTSRTKFYDDLEAKQLDYNNKEYKNLKESLDKKLITEEEYDAQMGVLDAIVKQRSADIKAIVRADRDEELAYLKTFYYDAKVFEEQKAADAIVKINQDAATKLQNITSASNAIILDLENKKRQTILSYNSQIFEENRRLALAQAELAQAEAKASAWRNPFTARRTIRDIEEAFAIILSQIRGAANPFAGQLLEQNILDNQVPVITDGTNQFYKGTDNTSVSLTGATVDNRGGKLAVLHPDEAVFSKADMTQMTRFLGKRPTRDEVIERFKMGTKLIDSNSFIQKISPYVISKTEGNVNIDLNGLRSDLSKLTREVVKRQQPIVNIDKNGIRTYLTNINSQIEIKNQKFSS